MSKKAQQDGELLRKQQVIDGLTAKIAHEQQRFRECAAKEKFLLAEIQNSKNRLVFKSSVSGKTDKGANAVNEKKRSELHLIARLEKQLHSYKMRLNTTVSHIKTVKNEVNLRRHQKLRSKTMYDKTIQEFEQARAKMGAIMDEANQAYAATHRLHAIDRTHTDRQTDRQRKAAAP